ncbi:Octaprenyl-diphosphate synthase [Candidatus Fokinia solitaria]|uniref:Octaprenyl-diphosphate synthase n=1 Tax=Candidatus Fokinia solitaria TaxID=1802984 RepID=A0A2U8BTC9_9RICK|nr:polyprenyl synthetase family protein [Candidatus Fokinia solitaria]AWD33535.1 Octaprenyl-diphosphate synthase [Candidatus Fokinia solitaria]
MIFQDDITRIENIIYSCFESQSEERRHQLIPKVAKHILSAGGKRIRPYLALLIMSYSMKDTDFCDASLSICAAIELLHTATLLHDDVIDHSAYRRNIKTANKIWGNNTSILVGNNLFSKAFELIAKTKSYEIMETLARASSHITQAEIKQLTIIGQYNIEKKEYLSIIYGKTGALFEATAKIAAMWKKYRNASKWARLGRNIGILFQIKDDVLDYTSHNTGKKRFQDILERKTTLPLMILVENANSQEMHIIKEIFDSKRGVIAESKLDTIAHYMQKYQIVEKIPQYTKCYLDESIAILNDLNKNANSENAVLAIQECMSIVHHLSNFESA